MDDITSYTGESSQSDFSRFMKRVDKLIQTKTGMGVFDFADACWRDLFDDTEGQASDEDILDTLADADDLFALMLQEMD